MFKKIIAITLGISAFITIGWFANEIYQDYDYQRTYDGFRWDGNYTHAQAIDKAREYDNYGNWVCVNVRNMGMERASETCNHEVGHEIFAEICEKNMTRCLGVLNETE